MNRSSVAFRSTRSVVRMRQWLFALSAIMAVVVADPALARRGKGGMPPGVELAPLAAPAGPEAVVKQPTVKPLLHPRRHGSKPRGATR